MNIPEEAIEAATGAIRDDIMRVPASVRPLVMSMLVRNLEAAAPVVAAQALRDAEESIVQTAIDADKSTPYKDGKSDGLLCACRIINRRADGLDPR